VTDPSDLVMLTDVEVRRTLAGRRLRYSVLSPVGVWLGRGSLRVLRVKPLNDEAGGLDLVLGYESYEKCKP